MQKGRKISKVGHDKVSRSNKNRSKNKNVTYMSFSQNFITDKKLINRIISISNINKNDTVLEIGTGKGHLTEALCRRGGYVYSIEIDRKLYEKTREKLSKFSNLKLIHGDFLNCSLPTKEAYKVFANIPYFITTQIVGKLTEVSNSPTDIWLVMEKGAAKRFMGLPRETEKSLLLKVNWEMEIIYHFRREDFHPMPSVDSVLLHFSKKAVPDLNRNEYYAYKKFVQHSMKYGICGKRGLLTRRQVSVALKQADLPDLPENGATLYIQWLCLFRCYQTLSHR